MAKNKNNLKNKTWRRKWQPTPVFLPGESHGQRSLAGYIPWGHKSRKRLSDKTTLLEGLRVRLHGVASLGDLETPAFSLAQLQGGTHARVSGKEGRRRKPLMERKRKGKQREKEKEKKWLCGLNQNPDFSDPTGKQNK